MYWFIIKRMVQEDLTKHFFVLVANFNLFQQKEKKIYSEVREEFGIFEGKPAVKVDYLEAPVFSLYLKDNNR